MVWLEKVVWTRLKPLLWSTQLMDQRMLTLSKGRHFKCDWYLSGRAMGYIHYPEVANLIPVQFQLCIYFLFSWSSELAMILNIIADYITYNIGSDTDSPRTKD